MTYSILRVRGICRAERNKADLVSVWNAQDRYSDFNGSTRTQVTLGRESNATSHLPQSPHPSSTASNSVPADIDL